MLLHIRLDYQGPGKLKNIGWAKPLIFFELLGISHFLGSIIGGFISVSLNIGYANAHPAHPLPGSLIMVRWVVEFLWLMFEKKLTILNHILA